MEIASFSGISSGIQWRDMIDQLMAYYAKPVDRLAAQKKAAQERSTAWEAYRTRVATLQSAAVGLADGSKLRKATTTVENLSTGMTALRADASAGAPTGSYRVEVLALAAAEKLGGSAFASRTAALGFAGELLVNGHALTVAADDSLDDIAQRFNDANRGSTPTGVSASVLATAGDQWRLVLASDEKGSAGIDLRDVSGGVLRALGVIDSATAAAATADATAVSRTFAAADVAVAELLGLTGTAPAGSVTIGTNTIALDLASDTLATIAGKLNAAAPGSARVVTDATAGTHTLELSGSAKFVDANGVLETLGVLRATRTSAAQQLQGARYLVGDGGPAATATDTLTTLWQGSATAGIATGDVLTLAGTRADGSTFSRQLTVAADTDLQDVLDALNASTGFGADSSEPLRPTAAATLQDGRIIIDDGRAGDSSLALTITAADPATGALRNVGTVGTSQTGRTRVLSAAADAVVRVDGTYQSSSSNELSAAIPGVNLSLFTTGTVNLTVNRDVNGGVGAIAGLVTAYNDLASWVATQLAPPVTGATAAPLHGDGSLRAMQAALRQALDGTVASGVAGSYTRLADIGIEVDRYGKFNVDQSKLTDAVRLHNDDVQALLGTIGRAADASFQYLSSTSDTAVGSYTVAVTSAATAAARSATLAPAYVATGTGDTLDILDLASGRSYGIALSNGMSAADIASALTTAFATATSRQLRSAAVLTTGGVNVTGSTQLSAIDAAAAIAAGDRITISGKSSSGADLTPYTYTVGNGDTLQDLLDTVAGRLGEAVDVAVQAGRIELTAAAAGATSFELTLTHEEATGAQPFPAFTVVTEGRGIASIEAAAAGDVLTLTHDDYGTAAGFTLSYGGGVLGDPLGLAGTYRGTDVVATIGGAATTATGRSFTGATGTSAAGLSLSYNGSSATSTTVRFSRGIGALLEAAAKTLTQTGGRIDTLVQGLDTRIQSLGDRADTMQQRLEGRRTQLIRQFTAMEAAMSRAQSQSAWLTSTMSQFENSRK